jgi:uncharacterized protein (DUF427 family)
METGLPPRYYIPPEDVREEVLVPSDGLTRCPYKGVASYYSVEAVRPTQQGYTPIDESLSHGSTLRA